MKCAGCQREVVVPEPVGRREGCPHCRSDLHACRNCRHFDPKSYNECRETQADRVVDKERSNFCDYFSPHAVGAPGAKPALDPKEEARRKLEELFKKR